MHTSSVGIRKNLKIDTSVLPVKYQANTTDNVPLEVMRFNLDPSSSSLVEVKARAGNIGGGTDRASFVFTQRIRRGNTGVASVDERDDDHTFKTDSDMKVYIEPLNPTELFTLHEPAPDLGINFFRFYLKDYLPQAYDVWTAGFGVLTPPYATQFVSEYEFREFRLGNISLPNYYYIGGGANDRIHVTEDNGYYEIYDTLQDRTSIFIVDITDNHNVYKVGDVVKSGSVINFYPSDNFVSSGPNHALFVKGLNATNLHWTITVGQV